MNRESVTLDPEGRVVEPSYQSEQETARAAHALPLRSLLSWLLGITRPVHWPLLLSTLCRIGSLACDLTLFFLFGYSLVSFIQTAVVPWGWVALMVAAALGKAVLFYLEQFSGHYVAFKALALLRTHVFSQLWPKAPQVMTHANSGDMLASISRDVDRIEVVYAHTFAPVVSAFIVPICAFGLGFGLLPAALLWGPLVCMTLSLLLVPWWGARASFKATRTVLTTRRSLAHDLADTVGGIDEVRGYQMEEARLSSAEALEDRVRAAGLVSLRALATRRALNLLFMAVSFVYVILLGMQLGVGAAVLAGVAALVLRIFEAPRGIEDAVGYLDHSLAAARRLWELSHLPERVVGGQRIFVSRREEEAPCGIEFRNVSYAYKTSAGESTPFGVREVSLKLEPGSHTVIKGVSGSGKSTLAKLLLRFDNPDAGQILVDGQEVGAYELDSLRCGVAYVAQKNQQLAASIAENLRLGCPEASDGELWWALELVEMAAEVRAMPEQLDTFMGEKGSKLSGGQVQRLCLARALLTSPRVLVLDEFTANLNGELERKIRENLARALPGLTILEITHRLGHIGEVEQLVEMDQGRIIAR